eukprot:3341770-Rhodomonas_salina.1
MREHDAARDTLELPAGAKERLRRIEVGAAALRQRVGAMSQGINRSNFAEMTTPRTTLAMPVYPDPVLERENMVRKADKSLQWNSGSWLEELYKLQEREKLQRKGEGPKCTSLRRKLATFFASYMPTEVHRADELYRLSVLPFDDWKEGTKNLGDIDKELQTQYGHRLEELEKCWIPSSGDRGSETSNAPPSAGKLGTHPRAEFYQLAEQGRNRDGGRDTCAGINDREGQPAAALSQGDERARESKEGGASEGGRDASPGPGRQEHADSDGQPELDKLQDASRGTHRQERVNAKSANEIDDL